MTTINYSEKFLKCYYVLLTQMKPCQAVILSELISGSKNLSEKNIRCEQRLLYEKLGMPKSTFKANLNQLVKEGYVEYHDVHFGQQRRLHSTDFTLTQKTIDLFKHDEVTPVKKATAARSRDDPTVESRPKRSGIPSPTPQVASAPSGEKKVVGKFTRQNILRNIKNARNDAMRNHWIAEANKLKIKL